MEEYDEKVAKSRRARDKVDRAFNLINSGYFNEEILKEVIAIYTEELSFEKCALLYLNRGHIYYAMGDYERAISDLNEAISKTYNPKRAEAYYYRGLIYFKRKEYDNAIEDFNEAMKYLEYNPKLVYYCQGLAYLEKNERDKAIVDFTIAAIFGDEDALNELAKLKVKYQPDDEYLNNLGVNELNAEHYKAAFLLYKKAAEMGNTYAHINLSYCYAESKGVSQDYEKAIQHAKISVSTDNNMYGNYNLGVFYRDGIGVEKNNKEAKKYFKEAAKQGYKDAKKALFKMRVKNIMLIIGIILGIATLGGIIWAFIVAPEKMIELLLGLLVIAAIGFAAWKYFASRSEEGKVNIILIIILIVLLIIGVPWKIIALLFGLLICVGLLFTEGIIMKIIGIIGVLMIFPNLFNSCEKEEKVIEKKVEQQSVLEKSATINTNVNFRSSPGTNSSVIGGFKPGDRVTVIGESKNGWTPVKYNGKSGWVSSKYIDLQK